MRQVGTSRKIIVSLLCLVCFVIGFYVIFHTRPFEFYTQSASEAFHSKKFERSIELYLSALKRYPQHPRTAEVLLAIGDIYNFSLGNSEQASKAYTRLSKDFPKSSQAKLGLQHAAEMYEKNEAYQSALLAYQEIIDNYPDSADLDKMSFQVAMMALKLKKFEPARRALMAIIDKKPDTTIADQILYQIGTIFFMEGSMKETIEVLTVATTRFPDSPLYTEMMYTMGNAYEESEDVDAAIKIYKMIRYTYPNPRVVENKIEKIMQRRQEANAAKQKAQQAARIPGPTSATSESQRDPESKAHSRNKTRSIDKSLLKLLDGEP